MSVPVRLAAFAALLALAFGGGALAGDLLDLTDAEEEQADGGDAAHRGGDHATGRGGGKGDGGAGEGHAGDGKGHAGGGARSVLSGLAVSDGRYALEVDRAYFAAGRTAPFSFRIVDRRGRALRDEFEVEHDKELHLIVARRDTAIFRHVHPRRRADGTWSIALNLPEPGVYRAYADFKVAGEKRTLATDLFVPGGFRPRRLPAPKRSARAVDVAGRPAGGLDVALAAHGVRAGRDTEVAFEVTRGREPFEALEPYLGAKGHLVALREGDLAYLHVHPVEAAGHHARANQIAFAATFPTAGRYRLFLQFKANGKIRTAAYTVEVPR